IDGGEAAAKGYYEQGIQTSMEQYGVSAGNYLSSTTKPTGFTDAINASDSYTFTTAAASVSWEDGVNKLQKIITQKWIANYPIGFEAWNDFRRTGYPEMVPPKNNISSAGYIGTITDSRMVRRLPYPSTEKDSNSANLEVAISMLGGPDNGNTDLWWAKKN
ncbi:MAG: SusD/RagB family nutrient-binding outer membrane lipoprotein, partial [Bacteroides acidifaciens]|nr:SusD/RagB family nutrient-binding outer membrane lipoprotein [Bacteroides acidifaciens]